MFRSIRQSNDERGVTLVIIALSLLALMGIAALAIDGGVGFSSRRSTQNAGDAAALAGAEALNTCVTTGCLGSETIINQAVKDSLGVNHVDAAYTCQLIDDQYWQSRSPSDIVAPCPTANGSAIPANADGVLVTDSTTNKTAFGQVEGVNQLKAAALAAAQLEKVTLTSGSAPFFACAVSAADGGTDPAILILTGSTYTVNPLAVGHLYNVWGPSVPTCDIHGGQGGFHGIVGLDTFTVGPHSWIPDQTGVRAGPTRNVLAGPNGCGVTLVDGCRILLPLCVRRLLQGNNSTLNCVMFGEFQLENVTTNSADALFIGGSPVLSFGGGGGQPGPGDFRVIRITI